jgi:hypothetical protein
MQGKRDIQVNAADAERLKQAALKAKLVLLPDTNHVLKTISSDDSRANLATYGDPALPLARCVVDAVVDFINSPLQLPNETPGLSNPLPRYCPPRWNLSSRGRGSVYSRHQQKIARLRPVCPASDVGCRATVRSLRLFPIADFYLVMPL